MSFTGPLLDLMTLAGGNGADGGGAGSDRGEISLVVLATTDATNLTGFSLAAGKGGDGLLSKNGGGGGSVSGLELDHLGEGTVTAGNGGAALGRVMEETEVK